MRYVTLLLSLVVVGCATLVTGTSTDVAINSDPSEAEIEINGMDRGATPTTVSLPSDRSHTVEISLEGYETETIQLQKTTSGWLAGNIIFGGIPGLVIDAATGGISVLRPKQVNANLDEKTASNGTLQIRVAMDVESDLPKIGQLKPADE
jgi:hypothetical protein